MSRLLTAACTILLLLRAATSSAEPDGGTPLASSPAGPSAPAQRTTSMGIPTPDAGVTVDPSRIAEARALVPPPLLYGRLQPVLGTWVEYDCTDGKESFRVRASLVGETRRDDLPLYQIELDYQTKPRTLVVVWVVGAARTWVDRLAVSVPPNAAISIPVDLYADQPELRGTSTGELDTEVKGGPFAGKARQGVWRLETGSTMTVVSSRKVPLFGVESIRGPNSTWVARKHGTGARPELLSVPISVPRMPTP